jgi:hypothetical protein
MLALYRLASVLMLRRVACRAESVRPTSFWASFREASCQMRRAFLREAMAFGWCSRRAKMESSAS